MRLESGITAPTFRLKDVYGRIIDLENYRSKKILIAFFRHAGCPFCNLRVHTLQKYRDELQSQGLEMIFFFESKESVLLRSTFHKDISPVPLISDPDKVWYNTYGLESSGYKSAVSHLTTFVQTTFKALQAKVPVHMMADGESINTMPAEFLVGEGLIIMELLYSERLNDRMSIDKIREFANKK